MNARFLPSDCYVLLIFQAFPIRWGICAPNQCSEEDVTKALDDILTGT